MLAVATILEVDVSGLDDKDTDRPSRLPAVSPPVARGGGATSVTRSAHDFFIIIRKKDKDKIYPVAIKVMGYWKDKAIKELNLKPKDKIKGNIYMRSKLYNGKYYTDVFFREIFVIEKAPIKFNELFVDTETGEILNK